MFELRKYVILELSNVICTVKIEQLMQQFLIF